MHFFGNLIFNIAYVIFSEFSTKSFFFFFDLINNLDVGYATVTPNHSYATEFNTFVS